jgi:hypothetical protein
MSQLMRLAEVKDYEGVSRLVAQLHQIHVIARPDIYSPYDNPMGTVIVKQVVADL